MMSFRKLLNWLPFTGKITTSRTFNIAWSQAAQSCLDAAQQHLTNAYPEAAIKTLRDLKNAEIDEQLSLLSIRLAQLQRDERSGILSNEQRRTELNRVYEAIFSLIRNIISAVEVGEGQYKELREAFQQRYRGLLKQKLASRQPINLRRTVSTKGTSIRVSETFIPYNSDEISEEIGKTFEEAFGRLLIVGQPGAGKTTLLLQLADRIFETETDALPLVINLASWQSIYGKLDIWLESVLASELNTTISGARIVLQQARPILLLDGLDELKEDEAINSCLSAIADYGAVPEHRFAITCRTEEYERVEEDARVKLQIEVGPLTREQLEAELIRLGHAQPEAIALLKASRHDPLLLQAMETPFYFNTLQLMFAGRFPIFNTQTLEERQKEITEKFVTYSLQNMKVREYKPEEAAYWLGFLASRMNQNNKVRFELRDLQHDWERNWTRGNWVVAIFLNTSIFVLSFSLYIPLMFAPMAVLLKFQLGFVFAILGTALGIGVLAGLINALMYFFANRLFNGLIGGLIGGLLFLAISPKLDGLLGNLIYGIFVTFGIIVGGYQAWAFNWGNYGQGFKITTRDFIDWSLRKLLMLIYRHLFILPIAGLLGIFIGAKKSGFDKGWILGLIVGVTFGFSIIISMVVMHLIASAKDFPQIKTPYQRFKASTKTLNFSVINHFYLRYLLSNKGLLPFSLRSFLNEMSARHLLETDGATWSFRHRIVQDYFAERFDLPLAHSLSNP